MGTLACGKVQVMSDANDSVFQKRSLTVQQALMQSATQREAPVDVDNYPKFLEHKEMDEERSFFSHDEAVMLKAVLEDDLEIQENGLEEEELEKAKKEKKEKTDAYSDLMDMEVLIMKPAVMENRTENEEEHAAQIRPMMENHVLSPRARIERDRVVRSLKIDSITRDAILRSNKSLKEVLNTYTVKEQRDETAKKGREFLMTFRDLKGKLIDDPFLSALAKAKRLYRIAKPFSPVIAEYKELYISELGDNARTDEIDLLLYRFTVLMDFFESDNSKMDTEEFFVYMGLKGNEEESKTAYQKRFGDEEDEIVLQNIRETAFRIDKKEEKPREQLKDDDLSTEQLRGIYDVDRFLISNYDESGGNPAFLDKILSLPARERLIMYFLIQNDHLESPNAVDITISQLGYIPNVEIFMDKIQTGHFKGKRRALSSISKRFRPGISWEKVEAAMEIIEDNDIAETVRSLASFSRKSKVADERMEAFREAEDKDDIKDDDLKEIARKEKELLRLEAKRNGALTDFLKSLVECRYAITERDSAWVHKKVKRKKADDTAKEAAFRLNELKRADFELSESLYSIRQMALPPDVPELINDEDSGNIIEKAASNYAKGFKKKDQETGKFIFNQTLSLFSKADKIPAMWGAGKDDTSFAAVVGLSDLNLIAGGFATLQSVMGAIAGITGIVNLIRHMNSGVGKTDMLSDVAKLGSTALSTAWAPVSGIANMLLAVPKELKNAGVASESLKTVTNIGTKAVSAGGAAVAAVKLGVDAVEYGVEVKHIYHLTKADHKFSKLMKNGELKGDDAAYADNILKLKTRYEAQQYTNKGVNIIMDAGSLGVSLCALFALPAAPIIAVAWAAVSVGVAVGTKIINYGVDKYRKKAATDDYLQLDRTMGDIFGEKLNEMDKDELSSSKKILKEHMAAELGFTSYESLYKHMMKNYAAFIYNNLFYENGDKEKPIIKKDKKAKKKETLYDYDEKTEQLIPVSEEEEAEEVNTNELSKACYDLVKSLGLKVRYPKKAGDPGKPNISQIAAKLAL